jgi:signal peptidase I
MDKNAIRHQFFNAAPRILPRTMARLGLMLLPLAVGVGVILVSPHVALPQVGNGQVYYASASGMEPLIRPGERFLADRTYYAAHQPARGDVVVYLQPKRPGEEGIKRIAAVAGDRISLSRGVAVVNGTAVDERYADVGDALTSFNNTAATVVPEGYVFVLGDNRSNSEDSRSVPTHGLVPVGNIVARATDIVWSPDVRRIGKWIGSPGSL